MNPVIDTVLASAPHVSALKKAANIAAMTFTEGEAIGNSLVDGYSYGDHSVVLNVFFNGNISIVFNFGDGQNTEASIEVRANIIKETGRIEGNKWFFNYTVEDGHPDGRGARVAAVVAETIALKAHEQAAHETELAMRLVDKISYMMRAQVPGPPQAGQTDLV